MTISKVIFRPEVVGDQKGGGAVQKSLSSKAAALFAHGAYWHYVSSRPEEGQACEARRSG